MKIKELIKMLQKYDSNSIVKVGYVGTREKYGELEEYEVTENLSAVRTYKGVVYIDTDCNPCEDPFFNESALIDSRSSQNIIENIIGEYFNKAKERMEYMVGLAHIKKYNELLKTAWELTIKYLDDNRINYNKNDIIHIYHKVLKEWEKQLGLLNLM